jgi:hypothetical protein
MAGDTEIGRGVRESGAPPLNFKAGEEFKLDLTFRINAGNVAASALDARSGKSMPVDMRGEMGVGFFFITFTIPFRARLVAPRP